MAVIGCECVRVIKLLPEGELPDDIFWTQAQPLTTHDLGGILRAMAAAPAALGQQVTVDGDFRISLATLRRRRHSFCTMAVVPATRRHPDGSYFQAAAGTGGWTLGGHVHIRGGRLVVPHFTEYGLAHRGLRDCAI